MLPTGVLYEALTEELLLGVRAVAFITMVFNFGVGRLGPGIQRWSLW